MKKSNSTKELILKTGMVLVAEKGFKNTGLSEILKGASIPKGSFYYYFDSKTDFGIQMIRYAAKEFLEELEIHFSTETPPLTRIENYFDYKIKIYGGKVCSCNCIFGKLAQELDDGEPEFQEELSNLFSAWQGHLETALEEARIAGEITAPYDIKVLARFAVSGWEGAILQGKIEKSLDPLIEFKEIFLHLLTS